RWGRFEAPGGAGADSARVGPPGTVAGASRLRKLLAVRVGTGQATEVRAVSYTFAGDEEGHVVVLLGVQADTRADEQECSPRHDAQSRSATHMRPPLDIRSNGAAGVGDEPTRLVDREAALVDREAVEQAVAAGADELCLAAAARAVR